MLTRESKTVLDQYVHPQKGIIIKDILDAGMNPSILSYYLELSITQPPGKFQETLDKLHDGYNFQLILNLKKLNDIYFNNTVTKESSMPMSKLIFAGEDVNQKALQDEMVKLINATINALKTSATPTEVQQWKDAENNRPANYSWRLYADVPDEQMYPQFFHDFNNLLPKNEKYKSEEEFMINHSEKPITHLTEIDDDDDDGDFNNEENYRDTVKTAKMIKDYPILAPLVRIFGRRFQSVLKSDSPIESQVETLIKSAEDNKRLGNLDADTNMEKTVLLSIIAELPTVKRFLDDGIFSWHELSKLTDKELTNLCILNNQIDYDPNLYKIFSPSNKPNPNANTFVERLGLNISVKEGIAMGMLCMSTVELCERYCRESESLRYFLTNKFFNVSDLAEYRSSLMTNSEDLKLVFTAALIKHSELRPFLRSRIITAVDIEYMWKNSLDPRKIYELAIVCKIDPNENPESIRNLYPIAEALKHESVSACYEKKYLSVADIKSLKTGDRIMACRAALTPHVEPYLQSGALSITDIVDIVKLRVPINETIRKLETAGISPNSPRVEIQAAINQMRENRVDTTPVLTQRSKKE